MHIDKSNNMTTTNVVQNVVNEDLPQLFDSRGGSHVINDLAFDIEDFSSWKDRFLVYLDDLEPYLLEVLENRPFVPMLPLSTSTNPLTKPKKQWSPEDRKLTNQDKRLKSIVISCLSNDVMKSIIKCTTAKAIWNDLILAHEGPSAIRDTNIVTLRLKFNAFKALEGEKVQTMIESSDELLAGINLMRTCPIYPFKVVGDLLLMDEHKGNTETKSYFYYRLYFIVFCSGFINTPDSTLSLIFITLTYLFYSWHKQLTGVCAFVFNMNEEKGAGENLGGLPLKSILNKTTYPRHVTINANVKEVAGVKNDLGAGNISTTSESSGGMEKPIIDHTRTHGVY
ncbi:hypothetical protein Tco_0304777 [Tanacetum coccineum]